jgi:deoxyribodipyrimidine photo-lyase
MNVPKVRVTVLNEAPMRSQGYVLYWMTANRRPHWNFALDRAIELAQERRSGLVVLEALRSGYGWANDRFHGFVMQGMADNFRAFQGTPVAYYPYVEPEAGHGKDLLEALAARACVVVTDDFPAFMLPRMTAAAAAKLDVRLEAVDSNGIYPMRDTRQTFLRAHDFRRHLQKTLRPHLEAFPCAEPLKGLQLPAVALDATALRRWPAAEVESLERPQPGALPINHAVPMVRDRGGFVAARQRLEDWMGDGFARYGVDRSHPDTDASSQLSFWLHFGHVSVHEVFMRVIDGTGWAPDHTATKATGSREGWWGLPQNLESYLDELITWREVGFNMCVTRPDDYDRFESLPDWAQQTLNEHASDPRPEVYSLEEFEGARTHDPVWNAAQRQLVRDGRIHNYLRMLWGKKILHWASSPQEALAVMVELNNKYAVDGRDPNSYSGIFWTLGRYDRPWGPEREVFGKIRYMTSESTLAKLKMKNYLAEYGGTRQRSLF